MGELEAANFVNNVILLLLIATHFQYGCKPYCIKNFNLASVTRSISVYARYLSSRAHSTAKPSTRDDIVYCMQGLH